MVQQRCCCQHSIIYVLEAGIIYALEEGRGVKESMGPMA